MTLIVLLSKLGIAGRMPKGVFAIEKALSTKDQVESRLLTFLYKDKSLQIWPLSDQPLSTSLSWASVVIDSAWTTKSFDIGPMSLESMLSVSTTITSVDKPRI